MSIHLSVCESEQNPRSQCRRAAIKSHIQAVQHHAIRKPDPATKTHINHNAHPSPPLQPPAATKTTPPNLNLTPLLKEILPTLGQQHILLLLLHTIRRTTTRGIGSNSNIRISIGIIICSRQQVQELPKLRPLAAPTKKPIGRFQTYT